MEKNGHIPKFLGKMNEQYNIPRVAIAFNAIISMIMVTLFRDWGTLAAVNFYSNISSIFNRPNNSYFIT